MQLSDEKDFNRLLETMVLEAKSFCHARTGILYLRNAENCLQYVIVRDDGAQVALGGTTGREIIFQPLPGSPAMGTASGRRARLIRR